MTNQKTQQKFNQKEFNKMLDQQFKIFQQEHPISNKPSEFDSLYFFAKSTFIRENLSPPEQEDLQKFILHKTEASLSCNINDQELYFSQFLQTLNLNETFITYLDNLIGILSVSKQPRPIQPYQN